MMMTKLFVAATAMSVSSAALAQDTAATPQLPYATDSGYYGDGQAPPQTYDTYRGAYRTYYQDCRRSDGTTGTLAGAGGGGLLAGLLGASPLGIAAGVVGGGLLGRHLDKRHDDAQNARNGC
jgi:hypothetical protein